MSENKTRREEKRKEEERNGKEKRNIMEMMKKLELVVHAPSVTERKGGNKMIKCAPHISVRRTISVRYLVIMGVEHQYK
jgi:hypothetical protein